MIIEAPSNRGDMYMSNIMVIMLLLRGDREIPVTAKLRIIIRVKIMEQ